MPRRAWGWRRALRWARRRPVRSLSATIEIFALGNVAASVQGRHDNVSAGTEAQDVVRVRWLLADGEVKTLVEQERVKPVGRTGAVGSDYDAVAVADQLGQTIRETRAVAAHRSPARRFDDRCGGRVRRGVE